MLIIIVLYPFLTLFDFSITEVLNHNIVEFLSVVTRPHTQSNYNFVKMMPMWQRGNIQLICFDGFPSRHSRGASSQANVVLGFSRNSLKRHVYVIHRSDIHIDLSGTASNNN
ncbi:hypothetical protein F4859DRAFT_486770 [Xylaria cf. heliscus]|nr:hypothetical protein F4859DRAFT_486770 [Xylaria cf. heliscus]